MSAAAGFPHNLAMVISTNQGSGATGVMADRWQRCLRTLLGMAALLAAGAAAVARARPGRFAVIGLPLGVVAFNSLLTLSVSRYNEPALPTMLILLVIAAARILEWRRGPRER